MSGMEKKIRIELVFEVLFHLTLCLMMIDWIYPLPVFFGPLGVYEITFLLMCLMLFVQIVTDRKRFFDCVLRTLCASKTLTVSLLVYFAFGVVTIFYSNDVLFSLSKYIVAVQMIAFCLAAVYYVLGKQAGAMERLHRIVLNLGISAWLCAIISLVGYFNNRYTAYLERISPIRDYNQYATILLVGLLCVSIYFISAARESTWRFFLLIPFAMVLVAACYEAVSRRSLILMFVIGLLLVISMVICTWKEFKKERKVKRLAFQWVGVICCVGISLLSLQVLHQMTLEAYVIRVENQIEPSSGIIMPLEPNQQKPGQNKPGQQGLDPLLSDMTEETYKTIIDGTAGNKRAIIWRAAIDTIKKSTPLQLLFGYGAGYDFLLYDNLDNPLVQDIARSYGFQAPPQYWMNSHNIFIQNFLEGGVVLIACLLFLCISILCSVLRLLKQSFLQVTIFQ